MAFFHFPNHILKLKALCEPQSVGEESLLTRDTLNAENVACRKSCVNHAEDCTTLLRKSHAH